jgi:glycosyltransferase involved in cell wall biosynthesis
MDAGAAVTAWDVVFNREVTDGQARYVADAAGVAAALAADEEDPVASKERGEVLREHARSTYRWDDVAAAYEALCQQLAGRTARTSG